MVQLHQDSIAQEAMDLNLAKSGYTAFYVDGTNGLDTYPGDSWEQPFKTIQHALNEAGSWCKIFIKSGTYAENLTIIGKIGIHLIGECRSNVIVSGTIVPITVYGNRCTVEELWVKGYGEDNIKLVGAYNVVKKCIIERVGSTSGAGVVAGGNYSVVDDIVMSSCGSGGTQLGIETTAEYCEFKNCHISATNLTQGIHTAGSDYCKIHDNTIENTTTGIVIAASSDHNTIFHNNLISNTTQVSDAGTGNNWFENFYDDHTTDTNNDGLADTEYSFTTGKDYQPVSRRSGWKQESLPTIGGAGGGDATAANQTTIIADTTKIKHATYATDGAVVADGGNTTTTFKTDLTSVTNEFYNELEIVFTSGNNIGQARRISGYVGATKFITAATAFSNTPSAADTIQIVSRVAEAAPGGGDATAANQNLILADVGNASAATLSSIYGILGNPSASLATTILDGIDARANNANLNAMLGVSDAAGKSINGNIGDFQAQTNLQTLLAALGIPDTSGKPLYTCLITDRLDHATHGLSALDTELGLIPQSGGAVSWNDTALAAIQGEAEDALEGEDLDHLLKLDSAAQKYPVNCATDSVIAKMLAKGDPAVPSTYDCTTDSMQALSDKSGGFSGDGGAAQDDSVKASLDLAHTDLDTIIAAQTVGIKKGVARTIVFKMVDATDFATPETGITVVETISKDGGSFNACTNTFAEISNGWYKILLTATEMNANEIIFKGTDGGCAQCDRLIVTES